jgi:hypothetical protein
MYGIFASNRRASAAITMLFAVALGGCSSDINSLSVANFNPFKGDDPLRTADYNYFYKRDTRGVGPVTAADLIGPDGRCAYEAAPAAPAAPYPPALPSAAPAPAAAAEPIDPRSNRALYFTAGPQANTERGIPQNPNVPPEVRSGPRGVALGMTECQVVQLTGYTDRVEIGAGAPGRRSVTLTYMTGERPGIYRFTDGRLTSMERIEGLPQPKKQAPRKTKTAKSKQPT